MGPYTVFILMQICSHTYLCLYLVHIQQCPKKSFENEWEGNSLRNRSSLVIKGEWTRLSLPSEEYVALGDFLGGRE